MHEIWKPRLMLTKTHRKTGPIKVLGYGTVNEYSTWRKPGAAAAASGTTPTVVATNTSTDATTTSAAGDDCTELNDFNKTSKSKKDYEILKSEEYFYG